MAFAVDMHIHSCLSPCADDDMTPNNIVGMAVLKGLNAIAVTDHNAWQNLPAVARAAEAYGLCFLPGLEVTTAEEVHVLCYFSKVEAACAFGREVQAALPPIPNRPDFFGNQLVLDEDDNETGRFPYYLPQATSLSIDDLPALANRHGGLVVPAHINRGAHSLLTNLGFLPQNAHFAALEVVQSLPLAADTGATRLLQSSDAHNLGAILERVFFLHCDAPTVESVFTYLQNGA